MLFWNKTVFLDAASHVTSVNQSECFMGPKILHIKHLEYIFTF